MMSECIICGEMFQPCSSGLGSREVCPRCTGANEGFKDLHNEINQLRQQLQVAEQQNAQLRQQNAELQSKIDKYEDRLQIDPGGSDKIDELEQAVEFLLHSKKQLQVDCSGMRAALVGLMDVIEAHQWECYQYEAGLKALSASSGKDMRVMQELIEAARSVCNLSECDYSYQFMERVIKLREILAKVKGHKNEWGEW